MLITYFKNADTEVFCDISRQEFPYWPGWQLIDTAKEIVGTSEVTIIRHFENNQQMYDLVANFHNFIWCINRS
jgi:hypothetical protein